MNKKAEFKNNIKFLLLSFGIVLAMYFVFGATFDVPTISGGNYSGTMELNCTIMNTNATTRNYNVTFFYNTSGGPAPRNYSGDITNVGNLTGVVWNDTANDTYFNITINTAILADGRTYNISCWPGNGSGVFVESSSVFNITIDNTPPAVSFSGITNTINNGNYTNTTLVINVSVSDATIGMRGDAATKPGNVYINISNSSGGWAPTNNWTRARNLTGGYYNISLGATAYPDGKYNITVIANDSSYLNQTNRTYNAERANINNTQKIQIAIDKTAPSSVTIANTTSTTTTSIVATITAADATSGIDNCVADTSGDTVTITGRGTGTQTLTHTGLICATIYKYIITCYDQIGNNLASAQTSLSTSPCAVSDGGTISGGGGSSKTQSWTKITPGAATIMKNFNKDTGIKEISIEVNNPAQNVNIIVTKYDGKPAEVSVEKSGKVYKYLQIKETNLEKNLSKAIVKIQVEKSWITSNSLDKTKVALFKFKDENWQELTTTFAGEDITYDYYTTDLTSFSYFAIGEKTVTPPLAEEGDEMDSTGGEGDVAAEAKSNRWWWVIIGVLIVAVGAGLAINKINRKKRHHKFGY